MKLETDQQKLPKAKAQVKARALLHSYSLTLNLCCPRAVFFFLFC